MFDADRPIVTSEQDRLGRNTFAKYLARCILDHTAPDSLVIGLYGGWGVGKTSVINLMLQELNYASSNMFDDEKPIILNFSAWSYSGQDQLIYSFFRRLSFELRNATYLAHADKIISLLELYISFFTHQPVPKSLRPKHTIFGKLFKRKLITQETIGWESGRDLTQVKAELNALLSQQKHKIIIIIDNISRLEAQEIQEVFQIVKSIGDFANTVYLLAMDKEDVELAGLSEDYLEKIVQLPFEIPSISPQDLEIIFLDRLQKIVATVPAESWNNDYWADLYYSTIKYFFVNVRDISRYINTVSFGYLYVKDVVNPVDYFAITALEVFAPAVYYGIRDNKDLFTDLMDDVYQLNPTKIAEDKRRCDEVLNRNGLMARDILLRMLIRLFPRLRTMYQTHVPFFHSEAIARRYRRICSPDLFDVYFGLSMPSGLISEAEMNAILSLTPDEDGFALALLRLNQDNRVTTFLDLLDSAAIEKIPSENISNVISALMDSADLFPEGQGNLVSFNTPMRVHRIFHQLLRRVPDSQMRFDYFRTAITMATKSLFIITHELMVQSQEHNETEDTYLPLEQRDFTPEQLRQLQKLAVTKIISWSESGRLIEHPKLLPILQAWKLWGEDDACYRFVEIATNEDKGLLAFLCAALKEPIDEAGTEFEMRPDWKKYLVNIEDFISPHLLEPHAKLMFEDLNFEKLREREQLAILIFLDLIHAHTVKVIPKTS